MKIEIGIIPLGEKESRPAVLTEVDYITTTPLDPANAETDAKAGFKRLYFAKIQAVLVLADKIRIYVRESES